jgi:hypothetical protein
VSQEETPPWLRRPPWARTIGVGAIAVGNPARIIANARRRVREVTSVMDVTSSVHMRRDAIHMG